MAGKKKEKQKKNLEKKSFPCDFDENSVKYHISVVSRDKQTITRWINDTISPVREVNFVEVLETTYRSAVDPLKCTEKCFRLFLVLPTRKRFLLVSVSISA